MDRTSGWVKFIFILGIIGALNWGLVGFFNFNLVNAIFGGAPHEQVSVVSRVIYCIVGLAGLVSLFYLPQLRMPRVSQGPGPR